jgi:hypothetical protein
VTTDRGTRHAVPALGDGSITNCVRLKDSYGRDIRQCMGGSHIVLIELSAFVPHEI